MDNPFGKALRIVRDKQVFSVPAGESPHAMLVATMGVPTAKAWGSSSLTPAPTQMGAMATVARARCGRTCGAKSKTRSPDCAHC